MWMMRVGLIAVALTACGDDGGDPAVEDARTDAGGADATDAGLDGSPGVLSGRWGLSWICVENCAGPVNRPALTYSGRLDIALPVLDYSDPVCADCTAHHAGATVDQDGCAAVPAATETNVSRRAYRLCPTASGVEASVTWDNRFGPPASVTWRLHGAR